MPFSPPHTEIRNIDFRHAAAAKCCLHSSMQANRAEKLCRRIFYFILFFLRVYYCSHTRVFTCLRGGVWTEILFFFFFTARVSPSANVRWRILMVLASWKQQDHWLRRRRRRRRRMCPVWTLLRKFCDDPGAANVLSVVPFMPVTPDQD